MFSYNLVALRKAGCLSRSDLAQSLYVAPNDIALWEDRNSVPEAYIIEHISEYFGVPVDFLLNGRFEEWGPDQFDDWYKLHPEEYDLFISHNGLDASVAKHYFASKQRNGPVANENRVSNDYHKEVDHTKHVFHCLKAFFKAWWGILAGLGTILTVVSGWPLIKIWVNSVISFFQP